MSVCLESICLCTSVKKSDISIIIYWYIIISHSHCLRNVSLQRSDHSPLKFRHCYFASSFHLYADIWLPGDRCVWNKHLPGCAEVAPRQWVSGGGSEQRVHASTHSLSWRNGGTTWACVSSSRQSEGLRNNSTTGSWLRRTLFCPQDSISFKFWVERPSQAHHKVLTSHHYTSAELSDWSVNLHFIATDKLCGLVYQEFWLQLNIKTWVKSLSYN